LIPQIRKIVGPKMTIIDSGEAVARQTKAVLNAEQLLNKKALKSMHQFYINQEKKVLENLTTSIHHAIKITERDF
jgi:glutamate racemase